MLALAPVALLSACIVLPRTVQMPDPNCQLMARHVVLDVSQVGAIGGCANQGCVALIVVFGVATAASAIVSGTISVVGNVAYWIERQANCTPPVAHPEIDALTPEPAR